MQRPRGLDLLLRAAPTAAEKYEALRRTDCLTEVGLRRRDDVVALIQSCHGIPGGPVNFDSEDNDQRAAFGLAHSPFLNVRGLRLYALEAVEYWTWDAGGRGAPPVEQGQGDTLTGLTRPALPALGNGSGCE